MKRQRNKNHNESLVPEREKLFVVGIGASAGGLGALRPFVANLPKNSSMGYVIAQHVSPQHRSMMVDLLARETELPVLEVADGTIIKANNIYITPPNKDVFVKKGRLRLREPHIKTGPKPSVDYLLASLAEDLGEQAIGIILSGTGSDGTHGMRAIKSHGGITIAQTPESAKYNSMPQSSIRSGVVDLVLEPEQIAEKLGSIIASPYTVVVEEQLAAPLNTLQESIYRIKLHCKIDFSGYKEATIGRQIDRRLAALQLADIEEYMTYVTNTPSELETLAERFLISVTSFFRDHKAFEVLNKSLGEILAGKKPGDEIRVWVPGCATGEEVYTIAILLAERLGQEMERYNIKVFGTDIAMSALDTARKAVYPEASVSEMDQTILQRYLIESGRDYQVHKRIRETVVFARHDLVQDPPFLRMDLISCRNLLIYFKPELQEQVFKTFHYALRPRGFLFLGMSEAVSQHDALFESIHPKVKIFKRKNVPTPHLLPFTMAIDAAFARKREFPANDESKPEDLVKGQLLEAYAPPSVLIDATHTCRHFYGDVTSFVHIADMQADLNLLSIIRPEFRTEIRAMVHKAASENKGATGRLQRVNLNGDEQYIRISAHPISNPTADAGMMLVSFEKHVPGTRTDTNVAEQQDINDLQVVELEHELSATKEHLQTVIEELETSNEELQSINEELQASSEELQSSNEELQSTNEELTTVNQELQVKTAELSEANAHLENIQQSIKLPMVVVDAKLRIHRFSPEAVRIFGVVESDIGNSLLSLPTHIQLNNLKSKIQQVIDNSQLYTEKLKGGEYAYLMRMYPYINPLGQTNGAVLTFTDITELSTAEEQLRQSATVFENTSDAVMITDIHSNIIDVNAAYCKITGYAKEEVKGRKPNVIRSDRHDDNFYAVMWQSLLTTGNWQGEIWNRRKNGEVFPVWETISAVYNNDGDTTHYVAIFSDITHIKNSQDELTYLAHHDPLTGLPNRILVKDRIDHALNRAQRSDQKLALLFVDLDNFKNVNDSLGHPAGDQLLKHVAEMLTKLVRKEDTVARLGGDEFVILVESVSDVEHVSSFARKLIEAFQNPLEIERRKMLATVSIGISLFPRDGHDADSLLKNADSAMYRAKQQGRNGFQFYERELTTQAEAHMTLISDLHHAQEHNQFQLYYQPQVSLGKGEIVGVEALIRWQPSDRKLLLPEQFIPLAEDYGVITSIGSFALKRACEQFMAWREAGITLNHIAVNVSPIQIERSDIVNEIKMICNETGFDPSWLDLEITETTLMQKPGEFTKVMNEFKELNVQISIDDFGTGYSSLSILKQLPVNRLKIDRSFIIDIPHDRNDVAITRAIFALGESLQLDILAEGVETTEQEQYLKEMGCEFAQGFLYSRPVTSDAFEYLYRRK